MHICEQCKGKIVDVNSKSQFTFPSFTVAGGIFGVLGATLSGALLLIPAGLIAGVLADHSKCDYCNNEIDDTDPGYHLMEANDTEMGQTVATPLNKSREKRNTTEKSKDNFESLEYSNENDKDSYMQNSMFPDSDGDFEHEDPLDLQQYLYDDISEQFIPINSTSQESNFDMNYDLSIGSEFDIGDTDLSQLDTPEDRLHPDETYSIDTISDDPSPGNIFD